MTVQIRAGRHYGLSAIAAAMRVYPVAQPMSPIARDAVGEGHAARPDSGERLNTNRSHTGCNETG